MSVVSGSVAQCLSKATRSMHNEAVTLQVHVLKQISVNEGATTRYRMELTDGVGQLPSMIATQLNAMVSNGEVKQGSIITINQFMINEVSNQK